MRGALNKLQVGGAGAEQIYAQLISDMDIIRGSAKVICHLSEGLNVHSRSSVSEGLNRPDDHTSVMHCREGVSECLMAF